MLSLLATRHANRIMNPTNSIRFACLATIIKDRLGSIVLKERRAFRGYLEKQEGSVEDGRGAGDVKDELLEAREGR